MTQATIDGLDYIPVDEAQIYCEEEHCECSDDLSVVEVPVVVHVDCDGAGIHLGSKVYVRLSALKQYGMTQASRNGVLEETIHKEDEKFLRVKFDSGFSWNFPVQHIRRAK